jgi:hypothetical protein
VYWRFTSKSERSPTDQPSASRSLKKQARITKKIRTAQGVWQFSTLQHVNNRYVWGKRQGHYYIEWWERRRRCRQIAGQTPTQATEAQRLFAGVDLNDIAITPDNNLNGSICGMNAKDVLSRALGSIHRA